MWREPEEYNDELGHISNAQLVPLGELQQRVKDVPTDKPIVTVCKSGRRSGQATVILKKQGIAQDSQAYGAACCAGIRQICPSTEVKHLA